MITTSLDRVSNMCYTYNRDYTRRNMNKSVDYIIGKMMEYSKIPSLTYYERDMLKYLEEDIPTKHYDLDKTNPKYLLYRYKGKTKYLVLAHVDRIEVEKVQLCRHNGRLTGQLDNVISVAICRYLIEWGTPVDFLFTTQEECLQSAGQIGEAYEKCGNDYYVMDMDIDVALNQEEVMRGVISLRDKDNLAPYCNEAVMEMRRICDENEIAYSTKDNDWLVCQIGTAINAMPKLKGMYLGLPIGNYHSNEEYVLTSCISKIVKLFLCMKRERMSIEPIIITFNFHGRKTKVELLWVGTYVEFSHIVSIEGKDTTEMAEMYDDEIEEIEKVAIKEFKKGI